jgi:phage shock protein PspC (stress-responsive transcriptional regulator)
MKAAEWGIMAGMSDVNGAAGRSSATSLGDAVGSGATADPGSGSRPGSASGPGGQGSEPGGRRRLERKIAGRWLAGVCVGLADYLSVDVTLVRAGIAVLTFFSGIGAVIYVVGWLLLPEEGEPTSILEQLINKTGA